MEGTAAEQSGHMWNIIAAYHDWRQSLMHPSYWEGSDDCHVAFTDRDGWDSFVRGLGLDSIAPVCDQ